MIWKRVALISVPALLMVSFAPPSSTSEMAVPPGFAVTPYAETGGLATSIDFGPDTRGGSGSRLYVADFSGGQVLVIDDVSGAGSPPRVFASGFESPLGVLAAADGTLFVADSEGAREGPFGRRPYGRVWRVRDVNNDGDALDAEDTTEIVLRDLPNGRHNTNGLALGPDGLLYVTNGNSTDDGTEGGEPEAVPWSGSVVRVDPSATNVSLADLAPSQALVATGMRNLFDLAFSPYDRSQLFIPTNGVDDARKDDAPPPDHIEDSDDLLYLTDIDDSRGGRTKNTTDAGRIRAAKPIIDDFGFPSCLYNIARQGNLEPYDNPNPDVIEQFGQCPVRTVPRPLSSFGLHPSADGLAFQSNSAWGEEFHNDLFVAEFGNFFGDEVTGHKVVRVELDSSGQHVVAQSDFLTGALPLDVTFDDAGTMYVADFSGSIVRVSRL